MPSIQLDGDLLDSSIWYHQDAKIMFITALLMATQHCSDEWIDEIDTMTLDPTKFRVQPGCYGFVSASTEGLIRRSGLNTNSGMEALQLLANIDTDNESRQFEGRRMIRVTGGFLILNFEKYRRKDMMAAKRQKEYRERKKIPSKYVEEVFR